MFIYYLVLFTNMDTEKITPLILNSLALAMGIAGGVLNILQESPEQTGLLFGIAIFCLALNGLIMASKNIK